MTLVKINDENKRFRTIFITGIVILFLIIFIPCSLFFVAYLIPNGFSVQQTGTIGDTIGGVVGPIVGIIAAILTFWAFMEQLKLNREQMKQFSEQKTQFDTQLKEQDKINKRQSFESHFFELLKMYREFVAEMEISYEDKDNYNLKTEKGKKVFEIMYQQIKHYHNRKMIKVRNFESVCLWYECMYNKSIESIKNKISKDWVYHDSQTDIDSQNFEGMSKIYTDSSYPANSPDLAQYLRTIYLIVRYVVEYNSSILDDEEKYKYLKIIRVQLSIYEQFIILFNAFGDWGSPWLEKSYLTEWRLIKHIHLKNIKNDFDLSPTEIYEALEIEENGKYKGKYVFLFTENENHSHSPSN